MKCAELKRKRRALQLVQEAVEDLLVEEDHWWGCWSQ